MTSPYIEQAAKRAAYLPTINPCPCCGSTPALDPEFYNQVCIYCDNDECEGRDMQACGYTLKEAAEKWNTIEERRGGWLT